MRASPSGTPRYIFGDEEESIVILSREVELAIQSLKMEVKSDNFFHKEGTRMKGISAYFMVLAVLSVTIGMTWGIQMSASHNHILSPAHAHLNLIGWVTMSIFAFYYHLVPGAQDGILPKLHLTVAVLGLITIVPGIVMAIRESGETLAKAGSMLTLLSMLLFLAVVLKSVRARA